MEAPLATSTEVPNMPRSKPKRNMRLVLLRSIRRKRGVDDRNMARVRTCLEASALPQELHAADEDEDEHDLTAEEAWPPPFARGVRSRSRCDSQDQLRRNYEEVLGAMMKALLFACAVYVNVTAGFLKVSPEQFLPCLSGCAERIQQWAFA